MGLRALPPEALLVSRARDFLAAGPADAATLVAHVCQLPGAPRVVAEHLADALFAARVEFARGGDGRWWLASHLGAETVTPVGLPSCGGGQLRAAALSALPYVVVDVETTGSCPRGGDRITEIAAFVVRGGEVEAGFETLVNPQRPIPPMITALTQISWAMVKDAPTFGDISEELLRVLRGRVFVAHNVEFDWRFVCAEVERATGCQLEGERLCTVRLARKLLPHLRSRRLDDVAFHYGIEIAARHRAGGDARATAQVLQRLLGEARERECVSWDDLQRLLGARAARGRRGARRRAMPGAVDRDTTA
jgi:DNA polymerase-3 subunit epsilon